MFIFVFVLYAMIKQAKTFIQFCCAYFLPGHLDHNGLSPRHIKSDSDDDDLPNVTLDSVNETGSTALSIARAVQE